MKLNDAQEQAANHVDGPCLVIAVPGSGKTRLLVERVGRLIESGVNPGNIVCVTFTNKAADEMKDRICKRLGVVRPRCFVGTFHRLCVELIRKFSDRIGYTEKFTIIDSDDQKDLIKQVARQLEKKVEKNEVPILAKAINDYRENLQTHDQLDDALQNNEDWVHIVDEYLDKLKRDNCIDFSGLLSEAIRLLETHEDVRARVQNVFKYVQVDEVQDTNYAQFKLINLFTEKWNNILMVGDISQCVPKGTIIKTQGGDRDIATIRVGDKVACAKGGGQMGYGEVTSVYEKQVIGSRLIKVRTKGGRELQSTPEHVYFAGFTEKTSAKHFVYLMYKDALGYRLGTTRAYKSESNKGRMGYELRSCGESADKTWVVNVCDTEVEARYYEQLYSVKYGIPTWTFRPHTVGENNYDQGWIDALFKMSDSKAGAAKLLSWLGFDERYPHHTPKAKSATRRRNFVVTLCADNRSNPLHSYAISGSDVDDMCVLAGAGLKPRPSKKGTKGWRVESSTSELSSIKYLYDKVSSELDMNLVEQARFTNRSLPFMPASNLLRGMTLFVEENGTIVEDEITSVESSYESTTVYDIDVDRYHNFIGNGIVTHNSIYKFRGARYKNILEFLDKHTTCIKIELSQNYRSTPQIVAAADMLIRNNTSHMAEKFEAVNDSGEDIRCLHFLNQFEEADFVARHVDKLMKEGGWNAKDIAILYRMNSMSEPIERALANKTIKYKVIGGRSFYDRREVKDAIALLRFISNPRDGIAFHRIAGLVEGMGDVTVGKIEKIAQHENVPLLEACHLFTDTVKLGKIKSAVEGLATKIEVDIKGLNVRDALDASLKRFDYEEFLKKEYGDDESFERMTNIGALLDSAGKFVVDNPNNSIEGFLQMVMLLSGNDEKNEEDRVSMMSIHGSKGLEFPIIFMIGVEQNVLPHGLAVEEDPIEGLEEETRLCYVGITRAKELLFMSYCRSRRMFGAGGTTYNKQCSPSQFLLEAGLLKKESGQFKGIFPRR